MLPPLSMLPVPCISAASEVGKRMFAVGTPLGPIGSTAGLPSAVTGDRQRISSNCGDGDHKMAGIDSRAIIIVAHCGEGAKNVTHVLFRARNVLVVVILFCCARNRVVERVDQNVSSAGDHSQIPREPSSSRRCSTEPVP